MKKRIVVSEDYVGDRIDHYLSLLNPDLTRSYIQKLIKSNEILVGAKSVKPSYSVSAGDEIEINIPKAIAPDILPENIPLDILYEDDDVILINKPKGMVVHPAAGHFSNTLVNALMYHCGDSLSGINGIMRPGIVHRIDMDTTGVLIACKNDFSHQSIAAQLKEHSITRRYYALACGNVREEEGVIDAPIGRHPIDRKKMAVNYEHGKSAVTHYRVLGRYDGYTWIECRLETGRTHQIRVHMAKLGHPLLGDEVYGGKTNKKLQGQCLHAYILGFSHPKTGDYLEFTAPLPDYFRKLIGKDKVTEKRNCVNN